MGLTPVPPNEIATIVTSLEMAERPPRRPMPSSPFRLVRLKQPSLGGYRTLFKRVGSPWLWFSRLVMPDAALARILADPDVEVYAVVDPLGIELGMVELDFRQSREAHIAYFGLVPELAGQGHGVWLMAETLARVWKPGVARVTVRTCTLDHHLALRFYRGHGFEPVSRTVETFTDPRIIGALPMEAAPQIPLLGG